jgi:tRNA dimethylallyltransferase
MQRITSRITARIPALFDEIKQLHTGGVSWERLKSFGLEYRYGSEYVQGLLSEKQFIETLATKTWQFVRRQMTWFKRDARIHWMNPISDHQKILDMIQEFSKR